MIKKDQFFTLNQTVQFSQMEVNLIFYFVLKILLIDEHSLKAEDPIAIIEEEIDIWTNDEQLQKTEGAIEVKKEGISNDICVNDEHSLKAHDL